MVLLNYHSSYTHNRLLRSDLCNGTHQNSSPDIKELKIDSVPSRECSTGDAKPEFILANATSLLKVEAAFHRNAGSSSTGDNS